jgi:hypothetical protein
MTALRIAALAAVVLLAACGEQDDGAAVVAQPPGCVEALEPTQETPTADDVVLGDAIVVSLRTSQRQPWSSRPWAAVGRHVVDPEGGEVELIVERPGGAGCPQGAGHRVRARPGRARPAPVDGEGHVSHSALPRSELPAGRRH